MTNEECISGLEVLKQIPHAKNYIEHINMAIKALEQQPSEDCVSRQALIEKATSWDKHFGDSERCVSLTDIQNAPSVTPSYNSIKTELDCISREEAINELKLAYFNKDLQSAKDDPCIVDAMTDWAIRTIKNLPSVTPQPKTGHWIRNDKQGVQAVGYLTYHCSECGREICSKYHGKISLLKEYPYCHCGAKMEVEE